MPDTEPLQAGKIDTSVTRCFDLLCVGKYAEGSDLKLNIQPADKIPELITKNTAGEPVFAEPKPMCTIQGPAGHNVWVNINLDTVTTKASNYMALGIKKQGEEDYDVLYTGNSSRYVDVLETDVVELIPLASSTPLSTKYTAVKAGDTARVENKDSYDFGSVYRVQITLHNSQWVKVPCDLNKISDGIWINNGRYGVGPVDGRVQLLAINADTAQLASSVDGVHWSNAGSIYSTEKGWDAGPTYGNGVWCVVNYISGEVRYSTDDAASWHLSPVKVSRSSYCDFFHDDMFMVASDGGNIWTSFDGEKWDYIATINIRGVRFLGYGDDKWVCSDYSGNLFCSEDGIKWTRLESNLGTMGKTPHGCVYVNGNFYAIDAYNSSTNNVIKSSNGKEWSHAFSLNCTPHVNLTYFNNKLYLLDSAGTHCHIGLFRPDGTIDEV